MTNADLSNLDASRGLIIQGDIASDYAGISVSPAGDVIEDLIIGASDCDDGGEHVGEVKMVFGSSAGLHDIRHISQSREALL